MSFLPIGRIRFTHEELEKAEELGIDLIAKKKQEVREILKQVEMVPIFKLMKGPPPYVFLKKYREQYKTSVNFRIYVK